MIYTFNEETKRIVPLSACHLVNPEAATRAKQLGVQTIWLYERPKSCRKLDETPEQQGQCTCCSNCCTCGG